MVRVISLFVLALALAGVAAPAHAQDFFRNFIAPRPVAPQQQQQKAAPARVAPEQKQAKIIETPPAYEGEMARLAEILGALHYLRPLCGAADGTRWRNEMQGLIEVEQPPPERRDGLIASFNRSYTAYQQTYRGCTPAAGLAIRRYLDEGAKLSREIATRYGN
ncbi:MAG: TIGR02301 family protein [Xanthobacteraceae bacterium]